MASEAPAAVAHGPVPAHLPALDGLRGIAILTVLVHQLGRLEVADGFSGYLFKYAINTGWAGVQLFFVLSGFLITGILLDTQKSDNYFSGFYARRCLRIFPLYYAVLVVAFVLLPAFNAVPAGIEGDRPHQIWLWIYLSNWVAPFDAGIKAFPHFWSLAVEEQFYLLWPLLMWRSTPAQCFRLCLVLAVVALVSRALLVWQGASGDALYSFTICRVDALALGGAMAAAFRIDAWREWLVASAGRLTLIAVALGSAGALLTHGYQPWRAEGEIIGYSLLAIVFALVVGAAVAFDARPSGSLLAFLHWPLLRSFGLYSYAIYIFHKPVHDMVGKPLLAMLGWPMATSSLFNVAYIGGGAALLWVLGLLSYHAFEKHFLRLKSRFPPRYAARA